MKKDWAELIGAALGRTLSALIIGWLVLRFGWTPVWWIAGFEVCGLILILAIRLRPATTR